MEKASRKEQILGFLRRQTTTLLQAQGESCIGISAQQIAEELGYDRANVSKELNALHRQGQLIKRQGKPTRFYHRGALEKQWLGQFFPSSLLKADPLLARGLQAAPPMPAAPTGLESCIGATGSLKACIEQAKAAVSYPPRGLHTLITGQTGVGKSRLARLMYDYAVQKKIFAQDQHFFVFHCQDCSSATLAATQLFGCVRGAAPGVEKSRKGLVEQAAGGILYLDEVQRLPPKVLELLTTLLEKNSYSRVGETFAAHSANIMVIAASSCTMQAPEIERLARSIPVHIALPALDDRGPGEVLQHLLLFLGNEASETQLTLRVSTDVLSCLVQTRYAGQIGEMKSRVKILCSRAFLEYSAQQKGDNAMEVDCRHLPHDLLGQLNGNTGSPKLEALLGAFGGTTVTFSPGRPVTLPGPAAVQQEALIPPAGDHPLELIDVDNYLQRCVTRLREGAPPEAAAHLPPLLCDTLRDVLQTHAQYRPTTKNEGLFWGIALHLYNAVLRAQRHEPPACLPGQDVKRAFPEQYAVALQLHDALLHTMQTDLPAEELGFVAMYLYLAEKWVTSVPVRVLVFCHGHGVATGIAAYLNEALGAHEATGLSYDGKTNLADFLTQASALARSVDEGAGVVIFADMEPLTSLHQTIHHATGVRAKTIAGLSLKGMLSVADKALRGGFSLTALTSMEPQRDLPVPTEAEAAPTCGGSAFLNRIIDEILSTSLTFLNPRKAAQTLLGALDHILQELGLAYSDEIAVKFVFHCSHMLERILRGDSLKYPQLKQFLAEHRRLFAVLEQQMALVGEVFGVFIPDCERAYIAEIFLPFEPDQPTR